MRYLSVCSGIEAASVAFGPLGWKAVAFSEIEPFPCAVLAHHYPEVPNFGDMTKFREWPDLDVDVVVGGTPCQSFSVAGLRKGLEDPRGNLMLTFLAIIDKYKPKFVLWENVPGVISSNKGADFALFLDGLEEIGYIADVDIHDAQFFGVAQRRRRVFVCAQSRDFLLNSKTISSALTISQCLAEILVLILTVAKSRSATGLRDLAFDATKPRDSLQRRMKLFCLQKEGAASILAESLGVIRRSFDREQSDLELTTGKNGREDSRTLGDTKYQELIEETEAWREESLNTGLSLRNILDEVLQIASECITSTATSEITESKISTCAKALLSIAAPITQSMQSCPSFWSAALSISTALKEFTNYARSTNSGLFAEVEWVHNWNDFIRQADRACESFSGFRDRQYSKEVFPIAAGLHRNFAPRREARQPAPTIPARSTGGGGLGTDFDCDGGLIVHTLRGEGFDASEDGTGRGTPLVPIAFHPTQDPISSTDGSTHALGCGSTGGQASVAVAVALRGREGGATAEQERSGKGWVGETPFEVRRLTCEEAEFLQGFPRGYTLIPWRGKPADQCPDGRRYRALGNSWAVPVVRWIGERINAILDGLKQPHDVEIV